MDLTDNGANDVRQANDDPNGSQSNVAAVIFLSVMILIPVSAVFAGYWYFNLTLPTLLAFPTLFLLLGGLLSANYAPGEEPQFRSEPSGDSTGSAAILLLLGHATGLGVLILFVIRFAGLGRDFTWL
jgi:hypothetical protein